MHFFLIVTNTCITGSKVNEANLVLNHILFVALQSHGPSIHRLIRGQYLWRERIMLIRMGLPRISHFIIFQERATIQVHLD